MEFKILKKRKIHTHRIYLIKKISENAMQSFLTMAIHKNIDW